MYHSNAFMSKAGLVLISLIVPNAFCIRNPSSERVPTSGNVILRGSPYELRNNRVFTETFGQNRACYN